MATEETIKQFRERLTDATKTPLDKLLSNPTMWGPINFEPARNDLGRALDMMGHLSILPIEILPEQTAGTLSNQVEAMRNLIEELRKFTIEAGGDPNARKTDLINRIKTQSDSLFGHVQGYIPFLAYQKGDVARNINELTTAITDGKTLLEQAKTDASSTKGEIDGIVRAAKEASASVGVAHFTADFSTEAEALKETADKWLIATGALGAVTVVASAIILGLYSDGQTEKIIAAAVPKFAILVFFFTATLWCGRIYKALMHQSVINRHRANALKTFQAFVKASNDEKIRDAVLLETTRSIFSISPSGYIDAKADHTDNPTTVLEFVRDSSKKT